MNGKYNLTEKIMMVSILIAAVTGLLNTALLLRPEPQQLVEVTTPDGYKKLPLSSVLAEMMNRISAENKQVFDACKPTSE